MLLGIISDTHGLVRDSALEALAGCSRILHAGDIGKAKVIDALSSVAPVIAIRGNVDQDAWALPYPDTRLLELGGHRIFLLHDRNTLDFDVDETNISIVVSGHSHQPRAERVGRVLYLNPGSAGPRRFKLPIGVATIELSEGVAQERLIELPP